MAPNATKSKTDKAAPKRGKLRNETALLSWVKSRLDAGYPRIQTEPESLDSWRPWQEREAERAKRAGSTPRSHSMFRYLGMRLRSGSGRSNPQPEPPGPEPSLQPGSGC